MCSWENSTTSMVQIAVSATPRHRVFNKSSLSDHVYTSTSFCRAIFGDRKNSKAHKYRIQSVSRDNRTDVSFPSDYSALLQQAKRATGLALSDKKQLMEIEFPTAGLASVPGDGEGGIEMTESMQFIREFCDCFITPEKVTRTRIFFPEANEVEFARKSVFGGASFKLDYLTKPSLFEDFGFVTKVKMADRVKPEDEMFLVAYPYFNVNEMLVVEELYKEAVENTSRQLIIFNGELDRIRTGWPWKVLRNIRGKYVCLHEQDEMPSLKEVALDILPSA
ncbi:hypothetical protein Scep_027127 [Stephania cephalantha]|uniref:DUF1995 domain-containing protein n=1 Tax=Stephania cephalantha TaxID=152367 RepID=A0AAP0ES26_9MAGN